MSSLCAVRNGATARSPLAFFWLFFVSSTRSYKLTNRTHFRCGRLYPRFARRRRRQGDGGGPRPARLRDGHAVGRELRAASDPATRRVLEDVSHRESTIQNCHMNVINHCTTSTWYSVCDLEGSHLFRLRTLHYCRTYSTHTQNFLFDRILIHTHTSHNSFLFLPTRRHKK